MHHKTKDESDIDISNDHIEEEEEEEGEDDDHHDQDHDHDDDHDDDNHDDDDDNDHMNDNNGSGNADDDDDNDDSHDDDGNDDSHDDDDDDDDDIDDVIDDDDRRRLEGYPTEGEHKYLRERNLTSRRNDGVDMPALRRRLAKDVEEGISRARLEDPDIDAKDSDIRLLQV